MPREEAKEVLGIILSRRKFFEAQRFVFAALRIVFTREKKSKKFRGPWLVRRVLRDDGGHKVMTQGRALTTEVNEGTWTHRTHGLSKPGQKKTDGEATPGRRNGMSTERHRHIQSKRCRIR